MPAGRLSLPPSLVGESCPPESRNTGAHPPYRASRWGGFQYTSGLSSLDVRVLNMDKGAGVDTWHQKAPGLPLAAATGAVDPTHGRFRGSRFDSRGGSWPSASGRLGGVGGPGWSSSRSPCPPLRKTDEPRGILIPSRKRCLLRGWAEAHSSATSDRRGFP